MRIVIDLQGAQTASRFRGIGRYSLAIAKAIVRNRGDNEVLLALNGQFPETIEPIRDSFHGLLDQDQIHVWEIPCPQYTGDISCLWRSQAAALIREAFLLNLSPDIIYIASPFEGHRDNACISIGRLDHNSIVCATLHDLIPLVYKDDYLNHDPAYKEFYLQKVLELKNACLLLSNSEFTKKEGTEYLSQKDQQIVNISSAVDSSFHKLDISCDQAREIRQKFTTGDHYILYTGGTDDRKNLTRLIKAYADLSAYLRDRYKLIIVGKISRDRLLYFADLIKCMELYSSQVVFTNFISDKDLILLYNLCDVFIFPSWHEGFGLPVLEAMSCGAPVICSGSTATGEVMNCNEAFFDPFSVESISRKLTQVLTDDNLHHRLIEYAMERAKDFSWDISAKKAMAAFSQAYENHHSDHKYSSKPFASGYIYNELIDKLALIDHCSPSETDIRECAISIGRIRAYERPCHHIFVDISELCKQDAGSGIQRVTRCILRQFLDFNNLQDKYDVKPVYNSRGESGYRYASKFIGDFMKLSDSDLLDLEDCFIDYRPGDIFLGLDLYYNVPLHEKILSDMKHCGVKVFFLVYDLLPTLIPQTFVPQVVMAHKAWLKTIVKFDGALCISKTVAKELGHWLGEKAFDRTRPFRIDWFHLGSDMDKIDNDKKIFDSEDGVWTKIKNKPTFLAVSTIEPRKCQNQILDAFEILWEKGVDVNLIFVGKKGWLVESLMKRILQHPELNNSFFWFDGISDTFLQKLYEKASCLISASLGEGFGLTLVEAALYDLPIIARDIPVFREVAGENALYFEGSGSELAKVILDWLDLYKTNNYPKSQHISLVSWEQSAKEVFSLITGENL